MSLQPAKAAVLRSYRELLTLIKRLAPSAKAEALQNARSSMRQHAAEQDAARASDLHKELVAKIGFLRMTTPRRAGEPSHAGAGTFVLRKGELVQADAERTSRQEVADGKTSMEDFKHKHHQLMERQYFGRKLPKNFKPGRF
eukprot:jgi/Astpho2/1846/e_gw1.00038.417.1_t